MNDTYAVVLAASEAPPAPVEGVEGAGGVETPTLPGDIADVPTEPSLEVVVVQELIDRLVEIVTTPEETPNFMETPFTEYSTTDGLLLLLLVFAFLGALWNIVKGVF